MIGWIATELVLLDVIQPEIEQKNIINKQYNLGKSPNNMETFAYM